MTLKASKSCGMAIVLVLVVLGPARSQDSFPKATAEHERLKEEVGTWDASLRSWMQGPGAEPTVSTGVETVKLMPGGFWILAEFDGKFGDIPFSGAGHTGYDPLKKKYVGTWVDSMSPSMLITEGDYDPATKTLTMHAKGKEPSGKDYEARMVSTHKDKNTRVFSMSMKSDDAGGEFVKMLEITYTRRAK